MPSLQGAQCIRQGKAHVGARGAPFGRVGRMPSLQGPSIAEMDATSEGGSFGLANALQGASVHAGDYRFGFQMHVVFALHVFADAFGYFEDFAAGGAASVY